MNHILELNNSHEQLHKIVADACKFIGDNITWKLSQHDISEHIQGQIALRSIEQVERPDVKFYGEGAADNAPFTTIRREGWLSITINTATAHPLYLVWWCKLGAPPPKVASDTYQQFLSCAEAAKYVNGDLKLAKLPEVSGVNVTSHRAELLTAPATVKETGLASYAISALANSGEVTVGFGGTALIDTAEAKRVNLLAETGIVHIPTGGGD